MVGTGVRLTLCTRRAKRSRGQPAGAPEAEAEAQKGQARWGQSAAGGCGQEPPQAPWARPSRENLSRGHVCPARGHPWGTQGLLCPGPGIPSPWIRSGHQHVSPHRGVHRALGGARGQVACCIPEHCQVVPPTGPPSLPPHRTPVPAHSPHPPAPPGTGPPSLPTRPPQDHHPTPPSLPPSRTPIPAHSPPHPSGTGPPSLHTRLPPSSLLLAAKMLERRLSTGKPCVHRLPHPRTPVQQAGSHLALRGTAPGWHHW